MKPWIHEKLTEILGFEDDVVIDYAINQLEETNHPDPKAVQINLTGFLNAKVTKKIALCGRPCHSPRLSDRWNPNNLPRKTYGADMTDMIWAGMPKDSQGK